MAGGLLVVRAGVLADRRTLHVGVDRAVHVPASEEVGVRDATVVPGQDVGAELGEVVPAVVQLADVVLLGAPVVDDRVLLRRVAADLEGVRELRLVREDLAGLRAGVGPERVVPLREPDLRRDPGGAELERGRGRAVVREEREQEEVAVVREDHGARDGGELQPRLDLGIDVGDGGVLIGVGGAGEEGKGDEGHHDSVLRTGGRRPRRIPATRVASHLVTQALAEVKLSFHCLQGLALLSVKS